MIPKKIHYCWFGGKPLPITAIECIASWKKHLPDFEIIRWDESNFNVNEVAFASEANKNKIYGVLSDFFRYKTLYEYGGIYLDTDMLLNKDLSPLLKYKAFIGFEDEKFVNSAIFGCIPEHPFVKICYDYFCNAIFDVDKIIAQPIITTRLLHENFGFDINSNAVSEFDDIVIFPVEYFYPFPYLDSFKASNEVDINSYIKPNTYSIHLWDKSWFTPNEYEYFDKGNYRKGFSIALKKIIKNPFRSFSFYKNLGYMVKKFLRTKF